MTTEIIDLTQYGLTEIYAKTAVGSIARGKISNVKLKVKVVKV